MSFVKVEKFGPFPRVNRPVFIASALLIVGFIFFGSLFGELAGEVFNQLQSFITHRFRWLFIILMNVAVVFSLYIALSRYGDIRLGHQTEHPEYSLLSWFGMLFSAGIGIGLLYWGTAEPLYHFMSPPMGQAETVEAAKQAMSISFLHWGIHAWALYCVVALSLAYFHYRRGLPLSIRSVLYPLIGQKIYGKWGHVVDTLAVFGTMFGVVTSLGLGAMQINAGFSNVFGIPNNVPVQLCLIAIITAMATLSVMMGLDKGIKRLSDINIVLTVLLLGFMLFFGPTQFIIDSFIENIGNYVSQLIPLGFWSEAYSNTDWQANWTIFYWAWWVSWSPFVGIFVARISRGRTIREFIFGVLFIPMLLLFFWFTTFGGSAVHMELMGNYGLIEAVKADYGSAIFKLIEYYPLTKPLTLVIVVMIMLWFVTSSDSASLVIDMLTAGGDTNPPKIQRLFWALSQGVIAAVLLVAGGLSALQAVAIIAGFPFAIVVFVMMYCLWRGLTRDRLTLYRNQQWYITTESAEHNSANEFIDEHLLLGPPVVAKDD
ncbi:BCCT family transporter [Moraxella osloensis]|uniref:BCCT family transporter n=2 Tax=Pseudomonadota TaxID=1224 RepID=A0AAD0AD03_FAUOS|nr:MULTISPECIES: BCCT family transporter [Pseudomonadota]ATQ82791.1 BCCT family transporter [Moraxella osloensis]ATW85292.1 BCCT family transporter [Moraxella osloensis]EEV23103.1 transporter, betaine/carnitine/choline family [Enhydrobacter aerosaccus SK60]KND22595.1 choline transporter [Enhydrobacter aerosaccus]